MKQIKFYVLLLTILLGLSGCGNNDEKNAESPSEGKTYSSENVSETKENENSVTEDTDNSEEEAEEKESISVSSSLEKEKIDNINKEKKSELGKKTDEETAGASKPLNPSKEENVVKGEESQQDKKENICTVSIDSSTILNNLDKFDEAKKDILPSDGIILKQTEVEFSEGDTAFDVLQKITRENKIHMEFSTTPGYNTKYIEGIGNIYEFDCGELSGWLYKVNGEFPGYSSSEYKLSAGDVIEWVYTCDMGRDVGSTGVVDGQ